MIRKINQRKRKKNIIILMVSLVFVSILFYAKKGTIQNNNLESNILSLRNKQIEKEKTDIIYEVSSGKVEVYSNNQVTINSGGVKIKFYYDSEKITILNKNIYSKYNFDITKDTGILALSMSLSGILENNQKIVRLNMSGSQEDIVLGEFTIQGSDGKEKSLSIGIQ